MTSRIKALSIAICGLLNSDGGLVIWGSPADEKYKKPDGTNGKKISGTLCTVPKYYSKDQLIDKFTDSIIAAPRGINFHTIEVYLFN